MHHSHYPRPEYPRPDKRRGQIDGVDWLNLNGPWQFKFDGDDSGLRDGWHLPGQKTAPLWTEQIIVPFCWESLAAWGEGNAASSEHYYSPRIFRNPLQVNRSNHRFAARYEIGWYRREVTVPDEWLDGRRIILHIGAADFFTDVWCNGAHLGRHEGGYTPFEFDVTDALEQGRGTLIIRVEDPMNNAEQPVGKQWSWYTTTSGIWQTVFLEPRPTVHIDNFRIVTDIHKEEVLFNITCVATEAKGASVRLEITSPTGEVIEADTAVTNGRAQAAIKLPGALLWSPDSPQLYHVVLTLSGGPRYVESHQDKVRTYFGMREISTAVTGAPGAPSVLTLNGRPIYLRGALYQSYYPDGVYTAGDAATLRDDIAFAKKAGFQFLRIHIKLDDPIILHYADVMGVLLMEDFPNFGEGGDTPLGRRRFEEMMRRGIERDFNHPSIVAWCLFNETWGFGGQVELVKHFGENAHALLTEKAPVKLENRSSLQWVQEMWELAKSLDPTRLIEDMSVVHWEHLHYYAHGETDINSWHFYIDDYTRAKEHIENVVAQTYEGSKFNYEEGYSQGQQPLINSEFGGVGALDGDRDISWSFKFLTNELRRHGSLSAYIYTELHDVEWEYNGLLNYDRTVKEFGYDPTIVNSPDVLPINAPPITQCEPGEKQTVEVYSSHFSRHQPKEVTLHWRLSGIDTFGHVSQHLSHGRAPIAFTQYRVELAKLLEFTLPEKTMLCTLWVDAIDEHGVILASNYIQYYVSKGPPPRRVEEEAHIILRAHAHDWVAADWSLGHSGREEGEETGRTYGFGHGFFEWTLPLSQEELEQCQRFRILCEASARRTDYPQTDSLRFPTTFEIHVNGICLHHAILPDHPHDSRGALSYLSGGYGGYGYLARATAEAEQLQAIREASQGDGLLRLRLSVPPDAQPEGGLSIYCSHSGRYPVSPTIVVEKVME